jgi:hypothetical protein
MVPLTYVKHGTTSEKQRAALTSYGAGIHEEDILFLADSTVFAGKTNGLVATRASAMSGNTGEGPASVSLYPPLPHFSTCGSQVRISGIPFASLELQGNNGAAEIARSLSFLAGLNDPLPNPFPDIMALPNEEVTSCLSDILSGVSTASIVKNLNARRSGLVQIMRNPALNRVQNSSR